MFMKNVKNFLKAKKQAVIPVVVALIGITLALYYLIPQMGPQRNLEKNLILYTNLLKPIVEEDSTRELMGMSYHKDISKLDFSYIENTIKRQIMDIKTTKEEKESLDEIIVFSKQINQLSKQYRSLEYTLQVDDNPKIKKHLKQIAIEENDKIKIIQNILVKLIHDTEKEMGVIGKEEDK